MYTIVEIQFQIFLDFQNLFEIILFKFGYTHKMQKESTHVCIQKLAMKIEI